METTGERFSPNNNTPLCSYEHWHRYIFAKQFVNNKNVLDIACGEGYGTSLIAESAKFVTAVDIDKETIESATAKYKRQNLKFIRGNVTSIPINGEKVFDVIVSFETIEHVNEEDQNIFF